MTATALTLLLACGLIASAIVGPWMLRHAAPALVRLPWVAVSVLAGAIVVWLVTLLALGPMLALGSSGPALLPDRAAAVCQRCLTQASPFVAGTFDTPIPAVLLLGLPMLVVVVVALGFVRELARRRHTARAAVADALIGADAQTVLGWKVHVVDNDRPFAFAFPAHQGGIVVSAGALRALDHDELTAVLAHEHAHVRQRHHLMTDLVTSIAKYLRWVPLIAAAENALPHYLEIAADNSARRTVGTPALVSALVKLGERTAPTLGNRPVTGVLHAAGPERIDQLVNPRTGRAGTLAAAVVTSHLTALTAVSATVYALYASAVLAGCI